MRLLLMACTLADRRINAAYRSSVQPGLSIAGWAIARTAPRPVLVRAIGPSLARFGVENPIAFNDNLSASPQVDEVQTAAEAMGAFPLGDDATSGAMAVTLLPGIYHLEARQESDAAGTALLETYRVPAVEE